MWRKLLQSLLLHVSAPCCTKLFSRFTLSLLQPILTQLFPVSTGCVLSRGNDCFHAVASAICDQSSCVCVFSVFFPLWCHWMSESWWIVDIVCGWLVPCTVSCWCGLLGCLCEAWSHASSWYVVVCSTGVVPLNGTQAAVCVFRCSPSIPFHLQRHQWPASVDQWLVNRTSKPDSEILFKCESRQTEHL